MIYFLLCIFLCRQTWLCFVHVFSLLLLCFSFICFMFRVLARSNQARSPSAKQQFRPRIEWYEEMPVPATGTSSSSQQNLSDCKCPKTIAKGSLAYLLTHLISMHYIQIQRFRNCVVSVIWHLLMSREQHYFLIIIFFIILGMDMEQFLIIFFY